MKLTEFNAFLQASTTQRQATLTKIIFSDRNKLLEIHRAYYNGDHWDFQGFETTNRTKSGKLIWGKTDSNDAAYNPSSTLRQKRAKGNAIRFHSGQLQIRNYVKLVSQKYQELITGDAKSKITVKYNKEEDQEKAVILNQSIQSQDPQKPSDTPTEVDAVPEEDPQTTKINMYLDDYWSDIKNFIKTQSGRMFVDTVAVTSVQYVTPEENDEVAEKEYFYEIEDPEEIVPIYQGTKHVGTMKTYMISVADARAMGLVMAGKKDDDIVPYAKVYITKKNKTFLYRIVDGMIFTNDYTIDDGGNAVDLSKTEEINFDPYVFVANLDHPFRNFDEKNLEDSEIFGIIEKNDSLNANETIRYLTNQYLAMPKLTIDMDLADKLNIDINSPEFEESLDNYQFFGGALDNIPVKLVEGQTVPQSFDVGVDGIRRDILQDASLPDFIVTGAGMSNVSAETIELGLSLLSKKIEQKREQNRMLIRKISLKVLCAMKLIDLKDANKEYDNIEVDFPELNPMDAGDFLSYLFNQNNPIPDEYKIEQFLLATGKSDDYARVINMQRNDMDSLREEIYKNYNTGDNTEKEIDDGSPEDTKNDNSDLQLVNNNNATNGKTIQPTS